MSRDPFLPSPVDILGTHGQIEEVYDLKHTGTRVAAPRLELQELLDEATQYDDVYDRAAFLLRRLITDHLFEDGNKRTAWVETNVYLARHKIEPAPRKIEVERVLRRIRRYDVEEIAEWLKNGRLDRSRLNP